MHARRAIRNPARAAAYIYRATYRGRSRCLVCPCLPRDPMHSHTAVSTHRLRQPTIPNNSPATMRFQNKSIGP